MSLGIDVDAVSRVLLADGWHDVAEKSFSLDSYEYLWSGFAGLEVKDLHTRPNEYGGTRDPMIVHGGGGSGVCATGFTFKTEDPDGEKFGPDPLFYWLAGPLTSILAVEYTP
jgi:hypothetical protein